MIALVLALASSLTGPLTVVGTFTPATSSVADCTPTIRMSSREAHAIKLSMLPPGHSMSEYELDHIVPLCMGGTNDRSNLQMQVWVDAARKDIEEAEECRMVHEGMLTCEEAQESMRDWKP